MIKIKLIIVMAAIVAASGAAWATETENQRLHVLPASGAIALDGRTDGWDLSGGLFACGDLEHLRDQFSVWVYANYDQDNLYVLAKWKDPTPLNNPEGAGGHAFNGDCLQLRFVFFPDTPDQTATWWDCWRDKTGKSVIKRASPGATNGFKLNVLETLEHAGEHGAKQSFLVDPDGKGYAQTVVIPWKLLSASGRALKAGDRMRMTVEPNFTAGAFGRITIKDLFDEKIAKPDRIFTFRAFTHWGWATLEPNGSIAPPPVRVADGRTFNVSMTGGTPTVDWTGLVRKFEWPGFKPIAFTMPLDGYVSLNVLNRDGQIVRHLLNWDQRQKGEQTIQWDGLTDATYRTPGEPVPAGDYTWKAIAHPGAKLTFRGYADYGGKAPWESDVTTMWLGDHGMPTAVVTDGQRMYLACDGAEGGRHLLATDLEGNVIWALQNTTGAADPESIATDNGKIYLLHPKVGWMNSSTIISLADAKAGTYGVWKGKTDHLLTLKDIYGDGPQGPDHFNFIDAHDGKIYLTSGDPTFFLDQVTDWKAVATQLKVGSDLASRVLKLMGPSTPKRLDEILRGTPLERAFTVGGGHPFGVEFAAALNDLIYRRNDPAFNSRLIENEARGARLRREQVDAIFGGAIHSPAPGEIVVLDGGSGRLIKRWPFADGGAIKAINEHLIYVVQDGGKIVAFDPTNGQGKPFADAPNAAGLNTDSAGNLYVSLGAGEMQVAIFDAGGKEVRRIGRRGGRAEIGPWQPDGMLYPAGIAVDKEDKLWVMERDRHPKRVSVWSVADGKFVKDFFGPPHYGNSGAAINPRDPDLMVSVGCEWRLDPKTGKSVCVGTFDREYHDFAAFREGSNGKLYLFAHSGDHGMGSLKIFERLGDANYVVRTELRNEGTEPEFRSGGGNTVLWVDRGGANHQARQAQTRPGTLRVTGSNGWSLNLGPDMGLYVYDNVDQKLKLLPMDGFTTVGAPSYDFTKLKDLPPAMSDGYEPGMSCALPSADNTKILINLRKKNHPALYLWTCFDLAGGKELWTYPNPFFQVHGSHNAPAADPGLFRGAYGAVGTANASGVGDFWIINGNVGEWGVLSSDGFYLTRLFNGNVFDWKWPAAATPGVDMTNLPPGSGGEDFGGSATQGDDGKIYVQAGKCATWNLVLTGLEKTVAIPGSRITLSEQDTHTALAFREKALQASAGARQLTVKRMAVHFTGQFANDFKGCEIVSYRKTEESAIRTAMAHDDTMLYVGWEVKDATPWVNGASDISQIYVGGDTVDLQLGVDPAAAPKRTAAGKGDIRLAIGNFQGKPTAVLYRFVSDVKKPRSFSSGVLKGYQVDFVDVVADAQIKVKIDKGQYVVEAAIPMVAIGLSASPGLTIPGDVGATFNDASGTRTRLRSYWSNQHTGLVDDVVFELQLSPQYWGSFIFE
ncbi:MAG TPA: hypothetical protein VG326_19790 [Tepidisphaeraceae bacterium]|jgi:hypothetical protein|nr:hypothetical protein [Tepidisphaeraceae bacterium]